MQSIYSLVYPFLIVLTSSEMFRENLDLVENLTDDLVQAITEFKSLMGSGRESK